MAVDLVVVGNVSRDVVRYCARDARRFWGGAGLNISVAAAASGATVRLVGAVGRDASVLLDALGRHVEISGVVVKEVNSCRFEFWYSGDGTVERVECDAGAAMYGTDAFHAAACRSGHYHICCKRPLNVENVVSSIVVQALPFSLDFVVSSAEEMMLRVREWIGVAGYVFVNAQEYDILRRVVDSDAIETLIVTAGASPIKVFRKGILVVQRSCPPRRFQDVTGAGDVFVGAFLARRLLGDDLEQSVDRGLSLAQRSMEGVGVSSIVGGDLSRIIEMG